MYYLGIDTSNYTSSVALVDDNNNIIADNRKYLKVEDRATGLRQSDALFQHWQNIPQLLEPILRDYGDKIAMVSVSAKPRPVQGSYMPVFNAGVSAGKLVSDALKCEYTESTHQEGHFKSASLDGGINFKEKVLCAHLSGGTLELVCVADNHYELIGGTKDISYGKLLDRIGVLLGYEFPAGARLDELACGFNGNERKNPFCKIHIDNTFTNISGLETQVVKASEMYSHEEIAYYLMDRLSESFIKITEAGMLETGAETVLVSGGIASSQFLRRRCRNKKYVFGKPWLCSDNAVGIAALKGKKLWD